MSKKNCKPIKYCRLCLDTKLKTVFDLEKTPLANSFLDKKQIKKKQILYPLKLNFCLNCNHLQLSHSVSAGAMFNNYLYLTNTSRQNRNHFKKYANTLKKFFLHKKKVSILDIASNDGTFLSFFNKNKFFRIGIDPAKNLKEFSKKLGIKQHSIFFTLKNSHLIKKIHGKFDIITANHVCAHVSNLFDFFKGVKNILKPDGIFVFEVSYLGDVITKKTFDTIYHEHSDYHSLKPLINFVKRFNLEIYNFELVDSQGGSIRIYACNKNTKKINVKKINFQINLEKKKYKLFKISTFQNFKLEVNKVKNKLKKKLTNIKKDRFNIAAYGAAAKSTTLMSYFGIGRNLIDFIIDDNYLKQNKFTPVSHIPIFDKTKIYKLKPDYILILAWNYADHIIKNNKKFLKQKGKFIIPFPKIKIIQ
tara:strand:+ start:327 stop:1580 length:1254 start_codon:yes stop_codon:yes gene_type:complete